MRALGSALDEIDGPIEFDEAIRQEQRCWHEASRCSVHTTSATVVSIF
jgi:hypothetical protein